MALAFGRGLRRRHALTGRGEIVELFAFWARLSAHFLGISFSWTSSRLGSRGKSGNTGIARLLLILTDQD
jgi:hypothetical protein